MHNNTATVRKVYFEVTNACNFRCDFCPVHVSKRKPQLMDYELFRLGVDQIVEGRIADTVGFHVLGEPLLYPNILDAVGYARRQGLQTVLTTNGSLLTPEMVQGLARARLRVLIISLQMLGAEAHQCREAWLPYEEYYGRVLDAIRQICTSAHTEVQVVTMSTWSRPLFDVDRPMRIAANARGLPGKLVPLFEDVYRALGKRIPRAELQRAVKRLNPLKPWYVRVDERISLSILPFMDWGNAFTSRKVYPALFGYCGYMMNNIGVLSSGEVTICCGDYDGKTSLGNLQDRSLASLLTSPPAQAIRAGLERMRLVHPHCQRCFGSTNPLKAAVKGLASVAVFKLAGLQPGGKQKEIRLVAADRLLASNAPTSVPA